LLGKPQVAGIEDFEFGLLTDWRFDVAAQAYHARKSMKRGDEGQIQLVLKEMPD
jgi:hypothetical protein